MNRIPTKELQWWGGFRWGMNDEMLAHMEEIGESPEMDCPPAKKQDALVKFIGDPCNSCRDLLVLATKKVLDEFAGLVFDPKTVMPEPDWSAYDGSESSLKIETNEAGMFTPPFEMEEIPPLACFMWVHLDGSKPDLLKGASGPYKITGNLFPENFAALEVMLNKTLNSKPMHRKWFDYHIRND